MLAAIIVIIIIWLSMWGFYKFMYPRAPKSMMPKEGDITTPRHCDFCGNSLAEYRGVLEIKTTSAADNATEDESQKELFFCNYEHQANFHAGKKYQ